MKCLCFSDSHGQVRNIMSALSMHPDAEVVFFLGDGLADIAELAGRRSEVHWLAVRGNCDPSLLYYQDYPKTDSITLSGKKIIFTHGDLYGVKWGDDGLIRLCEECGADIVLYGHTHIPRENYIELPSGCNAYLFNPGSIGEGAYGLINITDGGVLLSHGYID